MACRITTGGKQFSGVILDLSATGLFVQTSAKPPPEEPLTVEISVPGQREALRLEARVVRLLIVPPRLISVAHGGLGLRITNAPEAYFAFLGSILPEAARPTATAASGAPAKRGFRVRVSQIGGTRSRTLHVLAESPEEAVALAFEETGPGWKVLGAALDDEPDGGR